MPVEENIQEMGPQIIEAVESVIQKFDLNPDQADVVKAVSSWVPARPVAKLLAVRNRVCIVHGPFGSGKSTLLVSLIHFFTSFVQQSNEGGRTINPILSRVPCFRTTCDTRVGLRILVAAHTNVAVDRILTGLLDTGFTKLMRVGSISRMAKSVLKCSIHCGDSESVAGNTIAELKKMLKDAATREEEEIIRSRYSLMGMLFMHADFSDDSWNLHAIATASSAVLVCCDYLASLPPVQCPCACSIGTQFATHG